MFRTAVLAASLIACATLSAEEVRSRVVGIDAQRVVNCLGPPLSLIPLGSENHQLWVYNAALPRPRGGFDPTYGARQRGAVLRYKAKRLTGVDRMPRPPSISLPAGGCLPGLSVPYAAPQGRPTSSGRQRPDTANGVCRLSFEIQNGVVADFRAVGRNHGGVNADRRCSWEVLKCIPSQAAEE